MVLLIVMAAESTWVFFRPPDGGGSRHVRIELHATVAAVKRHLKLPSHTSLVLAGKMLDEERLISSYPTLVRDATLTLAGALRGGGGASYSSYSARPSLRLKLHPPEDRTRRHLTPLARYAALQPWKVRCRDERACSFSSAAPSGATFAS